MINPEQEKEIRHLVHSICVQMGKNQAHDWDGIESEKDIILYLKSIARDLPIKGIAESYAVIKINS